MGEREVGRVSGLRFGGNMRGEWVNWDRVVRIVRSDVGVWS